jgi:hypothetical protein
MKIIAVALIIGLVLVTLWLGASVIRLENYRQANLVGMCNHYNIEDPIQRIQREDCLLKARTRTHWFWHLLNGMRIL